MTNTTIAATPGTSTPENATKNDPTLSANDQTATDLTDVTGVPATNSEFLSEIFRNY